MVASRSWRAGIGLVTAAVLIAGTPVQAASRAQWAQAGYGPGRTFYNPAESVINAGTIEGVSRKWTAALPYADAGTCSYASPPVVSGGRVFVTDSEGIGAYAATTGERLWQWTWDSPEDEGTPQLAVSHGLLLVGNTDCQSMSDPDGTLRALDVSSGDEQWSVEVEAPVESLVVDRGVVVVSGASESDLPRVRGFDVTTGRQRYNLARFTSAGVAANGRMLLSRTSTAATVAVRITTGRAMWTRTKRWYAEAATPAGDRFLVSDARGTLVSLRATDGATQWSARRAAGRIATDGRRVYHPWSNGVEALHIRTGERVWTRIFEGDTGQPVRAGGLVYVTVDAGERIGIMNAANGRVLSSGRQFPSLDEGHVVVAGGWIYLVNGSQLEAYAI